MTSSFFVSTASQFQLHFDNIVLTDEDLEPKLDRLCDLSICYVTIQSK